MSIPTTTALRSNKHDLSLSFVHDCNVHGPTLVIFNMAVCSYFAMHFLVYVATIIALSPIGKGKFVTVNLV